MIRSSRELDSVRTVFSARVDGITVRDGQHYLEFRQPDGFGERESLGTKLFNAGARREPTSDAPWPRDAAMIGVGMGGAKVYVPFHPTSQDMIGVERIDQVEFTLKSNKHGGGIISGRGIENVRVARYASDSERSMSSMKPREGGQRQALGKPVLL